MMLLQPQAVPVPVPLADGTGTIADWVIAIATLLTLVFVAMQTYYSRVASQQAGGSR